MRRIKRDFSYLSAICPAVAENRKKGSTNSPAAAFTAKSADSAATMPPYTNITDRAALNRLSLNAPKNWVMNSGAMRRVANNRNCPWGCAMRMPSW